MCFRRCGRGRGLFEEFCTRRSRRLERMEKEEEGENGIVNMVKNLEVINGMTNVKPP